MDKKRLFYGRRKIIFQGGIYHVTQRATGAESLFLEESDYLFMLSILKEVVKKYELDLFVFALMPNHVHLLLRINKENLKEAMHNLFTRYGMYFNNKYHRKGHVFCDNYRAAVCLSDAYLLTASVYIHVNPYRAKIIKNIFNYRWSSVKLFTEYSDKKTFVNYVFILNMLDDDLHKAVNIYKKMMLDFLELKAGGTPDDCSIIKRLTLNMLEVFQNSAVAGFASKRLQEEIELNNAIKNLSNRGKARKPKDKKAVMFLIRQLLARGYSIKEIAATLKLSRPAIYRFIKK